MGRKVIAIWLSLVMMVGFVVIVDVSMDFTLNVGGTTLYVNTTGSGGAYTKIQDAINASKNGDTVFVYNGTYYENVVVNKTINLTGENRDITIIDGGRVGDVINVSSNWANITGFMVTGGASGFGNAGVELYNVHNCSIIDINISNNWAVGIFLYSSINNRIINNMIGLNNGHGVYLDQSSSFNILSVNNISSHNGGGLVLSSSSNDNKIIGNNISNNGYGINLYLSSHNHIEENNVSNNFYNIKFESSTNNTIKNNTVLSSDWAGIYLEGSSHNNITDNNACLNIGSYSIILVSSSNNNFLTCNNVSNNQWGIAFDSSSGNNITNNIVLSNEEWGISFDYSVQNNVTNNTVIDNLIGINLWSSLNNNINNNQVLNNDFGINLVKSSNNNKIMDNNVTSNIAYGMVFSLSSNNNTIISNNISNNMYGIFLDSSSNNNITNNNINSNRGLPAGFGIVFNPSSNNTIMNNNVSNNDNGIYLGLSSNIIIAGNNISSNNDTGIWFDGVSNSTITNNNISMNGGYGSSLGWSSNNTIIGNHASNNTIGIDLGFSSNNIITGNNVSSNNENGIVLRFSSNNNINDNDIIDNFWGISIKGDDSYNNNITLNNVTQNEIGILISNIMAPVATRSAGHLICNNTIFENTKGICLDVADFGKIEEVEILSCTIYQNDIGIYLCNSGSWIKDTTISNCVIESNRIGIQFVQIDYQNEIVYNNISYNQEYAVYLINSDYAFIHHNNFIDNNIGNVQTYDDSDSNLWNDSYPSGGNYWSDYTGNDNFKGPYQNIPGSDGFGDTPYIIDSDSQDNYPLMGPYTYSSLGNYTILKKGWNLISIPLIQENQDLAKVLELIDGWYDAVQWYDIMDSGESWKHHKIGKPYGNDLSLINETIGFWIHITQPGDTIFVYNGTKPNLNQTITLHPGWNMVGYPSLTSYNRTEGLNNLTFDQEVNLIQWYDASRQIWHDLEENDYFVPGRGYWIHANVECEWEVPL